MYNWTEDKIDFLKDSYGKISALQISSIVGIPRATVRYKATKLGLKTDLRTSGETMSTSKLGKPNKRWSEEEDVILKKYYELCLPEEVPNLVPGRTERAIRMRANKLNLKALRRANESFPASACKAENLHKLLDESPETYYWIGFLMADGHFTPKRIHLSLSVKDLNHLIKFANFIGLSEKDVLFSVENTKCSLYPSHKPTVTALMNKFDINSRKTYFPCSISGISDKNLFLSLCAGFIDGDGTIAKDGTKITIMLHSSWLDNLNIISEFILGERRAYINSRGLAHLNIGRKDAIKNIKKEALKLNLPIIDRKWGRIILH